MGRESRRWLRLLSWRRSAVAARAILAALPMDDIGSTRPIERGGGAVNARVVRDKVERTQAAIFQRSIEHSHCRKWLARLGCPGQLCHVDPGLRRLGPDSAQDLPGTG